MPLQDTKKPASPKDKNLVATDIRDIKGPLSFPSKIKPVLITLFVILFVLCILWLIRFLKKIKKESLRPRLTPAQRAYERLKVLKEKNLVSGGLVKEFYIELSDIARHYLEERFSLRAPEMTTEEFLATLRQSEELGSVQKKLLKDFLAHCDLVKFAKYGPDQKEIELSFNSAGSLIDQTKEAEEK